ncbi:hypothetical protein [Jeotgalibaca dankookensis]|uniref:hypothetical protein n=1 Tax=Jeotgalibaca dankookensis TaxID=708126 RepID=UPI000785DAAD|nr:hypothetical protein [Jeotgalibaca dankookensis]
MDLTIKKKKINEFLINTFVLISVVFPGDIYNLKKILFLIICIFNIKLIISSLINKENMVLTFFGFIFPTGLFLYSSILTGNALVSFSKSFTAYILLLVFVLRYYKIDFEKILLKSIKIIMITIVSLALLDIVGSIDVNTGFFRNEIMNKYELGFMGKSPFYPLYYKIFFKTSPLLVILLFKKFNDSKYIIASLSLTALVLSGTRANFLFPIFFLVVFYLFSRSNKSKLIKYTFIIITIILLTTFSEVIFQAFNEVFIVKGEVSNTIRQGHIEGIKELLINNPWIVLKGSGMGSNFYSYGRNAYVSSMEWSYIDLWRQMGIVFFFLFLVFISIPLLYNSKNEKYKNYAYITYLLIAATNPLLFSSTSYLVFNYMYYNLKKIKENIK